MSSDDPVPTPPFVGVDWNDNEELEQSSPAREWLVRGEYRVHRWLYSNSGLHLIDTEMVTGFHRVMFEDVWPEFAGRLRGPSPRYINRRVSFSNFRGAEPDEVLSLLNLLFNRMREVISDLDDRLSFLSPASAEESIRNIAAHLHCELVRIHPFVNGNGRTARMTVNYMATRYGYRLINWDRVDRSEYIDATRTYVQRRSWRHFADFLIPLMVQAGSDS